MYRRVKIWKNQTILITLLLVLCFFGEALPVIYGCYLMRVRKGVYIGLLGDLPGYVGAAREVLEGKIFPIRSPFDPHSPPIPQPPFFFSLCALLSIVTGLPVFVSYFLISLLADLGLFFAFYLFFSKIFYNQKKSMFIFHAMLLVMYGNSLSWLRLLHIAVRHNYLLSNFVHGILSGSPTLSIPAEIKMKITYILYNFWGMRLRLGGVCFLMPPYRKLSTAFGVLALSLVIFSKEVDRVSIFSKNSALVGLLLGFATLTHAPISSVWIIVTLICLLMVELQHDIKQGIKVFLIKLVIVVLIYMAITSPLVMLYLSNPQIVSVTWQLIDSLRYAYTPYGRPKMPYLWEYPEAFGLMFILTVLGIICWKIIRILDLRKFIKDLNAILVLILVSGTVFSVAPFLPKDYLNIPTTFPMQDYSMGLFRISLVPISAVVVIVFIDKIAKVSNVIHKLFAYIMLTILTISLIASTFFGLMLFTLRWVPKHPCFISIYQFRAFKWLESNSNPEDIVWAPTEISWLIPALSGNKTTSGVISTFSLISASERDIRRSFNKTIYSSEISSNWSISDVKKVLEKYDVKYLWIPKNEVNKTKLLEYYKAFRPVYENEEVIIFKIK